MARVKGVTLEEAEGEVRTFFQRQVSERGAVSNTAQVYALRPTILLGHAALAKSIEGSGLIEPELKNLACLRTALINGCPF